MVWLLVVPEHAAASARRAWPGTGQWILPVPDPALAPHIDKCQYIRVPRTLATPPASATSVGDAACCPALRREVPGPAEAAAAAAGFRALADPVRVRLLSLIATNGEVCACALVDDVDRSQPTVSHHLKVLREAGLVQAERRGTWIWYRVVPQRLRELRRVLG